MRNLIDPMELGDIFDRTFRICIANFLPNLFIVLMMCTVPCILFVFGAHMFYGTIADVGGDTTNMSSEAVFTMMGGMAVFFLGGLGLFAGALAAEIGVSRLTCKQMLPGLSFPESLFLTPGAQPVAPKLTWEDGLDSETISRTLRAFGFYCLVFLMIIGVAFMLGIGIGFVAAISSVLAGLLGLGCLALIPVAFYFFFRWSMALNTIAWENCGPVDAMRRSSRLMEDNWWRVFGILLLFGLLVGFGTLLITTPLTFLGLVGSFKDILAGSARRNGSQASPEVLRAMGNSIGISVSISVMVSLLIKPVYTAILYLDLRSRKGEFLRVDPPPPEAAAGSPPTAFMPPPDWTPGEAPGNNPIITNPSHDPPDGPSGAAHDGPMTGPPASA